jgi:hypothetical protein
LVPCVKSGLVDLRGELLYSDASMTRAWLLILFMLTLFSAQTALSTAHESRHWAEESQAASAVHERDCPICQAQHARIDIPEVVVDFTPQTLAQLAYSGEKSARISGPVIRSSEARAPPRT